MEWRIDYMLSLLCLWVTRRQLASLDSLYQDWLSQFINICRALPPTSANSCRLDFLSLLSLFLFIWFNQSARIWIARLSVAHRLEHESTPKVKLKKDQLSHIYACGCLCSSNLLLRHSCISSSSGGRSWCGSNSCFRKNSRCSNRSAAVSST